MNPIRILVIGTSNISRILQESASSSFHYFLTELPFLNNQTDNANSNRLQHIEHDICIISCLTSQDFSEVLHLEHISAPKIVVTNKANNFPERFLNYISDVLFQEDLSFALLEKAIAYSINKTKTALALARRIQFEALIAEISTHFINIPFEDIDNEIVESLQRIGVFADADRSSVFLFHALDNSVQNSHEWASDRVQKLQFELQKVAIETFPWFHDISVKQQTVYSHFGEHSFLPITWELQKDPNTSTKLFLYVPMIYVKKFRGFVSLEFLQESMPSLDDIAGFLRTIGEIFINALVRKNTETALRESEERYALAAQGANDGLWDWNLKTNIVYYSQRWKSMIGLADREIAESPDEWFGRIHPEDIERVKESMRLHLENKTQHFENEYRILHKNGKFVWMLTRGITIRDELGNATRMAGSQTDITVRKAAEEQLLHDAFHDTLTGLPNRNLFTDRLGRLIERSKRRKDYLFAVLFLDLDRFNIINDSLGHSIGDQLLVGIARRLEACLRPGDTVARLGGDQFTILLDDMNDVGDANKVAERIMRELSRPFTLQGIEVFSTVSIGITTNATEYERPEYYLRDADTAMHRAKLQGKSSYALFDSRMHLQAVALLKTETDLRKAIEREEFLIHYQPVVSLKTGKIEAFEALIRWKHPEKGMVPPNDFISIAEDTGLIVPIGAWILKKSCEQMKQWQEMFRRESPLAISVNLSSKQFAHPTLISDIEKILDETGFDPHYLRLEITESVIMSNARSATEMIQQLKKYGIQFYLDDFGTGYSSLSYLHRFPIDALKIDRSFVRWIGTENEKTAIIKAIITLAKNLQLSVIAEGIETPVQLQYLRDLECNHGQGYFFSKPIDQTESEHLLTADPAW